MLGFALIIIIVLLAYILITYNKLIRYNNIVKEAFSTMDVYLKKRWDLIPVLVDTTKAYAEYEENVFTNITELRAKSYQDMSMSTKLDVNTQLTNEVSKIMAISERYPDIKSSQNFLELSANLTKIEDDIANSRKYYNGSVRIFNTKIQVFPNNIVAKLFNFKEASMFEANVNEKNNVEIDL